MESMSQQSRGPGRNKRLWTKDQDSKLIEALIDLHNTGKYNADRGFKPGHYRAVEEILSVTLPNSGLKADPHIKSRIKTLKSHFSIVHDMIAGPNTSGFGYDDEKGCVVAEKAVWDVYLQSHKDAGLYQEKPFPHYRELCQIFGKDRATGRNAETPADVLEELNREEAGNQNDVVNEVGDGGDGDDMSLSFANTLTAGTTSDASSKKKRKKGSQSSEYVFCDVMEKSAALISSEMSKSSERLSRAIEDATINDMKVKINGELLKLDGLSMLERHKATIKIGCDRDLTQIFFTIDEEEKEAWVRAVI